MKYQRLNANTLYVSAILFFRSTLHRESLPCLPNSHFDKIYATHRLKMGMDQRREKEGVVILSHFDKINTTHQLKMGMDQRREKEGVVILSQFDKIYATHSLKLRMDQRRKKEGVVIISHFDKIDLCNSLPKVNWECIRKEKKREWLFLVILTRSMQLTS